MSLEELINKDVVVKKNDGYIRYGCLLAADAASIKIKYNDGTVDFIPMASISSITPRR